MNITNQRMVNSLKDKVLVMVVGPSAIGKSTVMNQVVALDRRFARVKSFTTRAPRANDELDQYMYLAMKDIVALESAEQIVSKVEFPTTGQTYGTLLTSYPNSFNLLDTLANSVKNYRLLPFKSTVVISLTTEPTKWRKWFLKRYPTISSEAVKRLEEAKLSINWSLEQPNATRWLLNNGSIDDTARALIDIATSRYDGDQATDYSRGILELIERGDVWPAK